MDARALDIKRSRGGGACALGKYQYCNDIITVLEQHVMGHWYRHSSHTGRLECKRAAARRDTLHHFIHPCCKNVPPWSFQSLSCSVGEGGGQLRRAME